MEPITTILVCIVIVLFVRHELKHILHDDKHDEIEKHVQELREWAKKEREMMELEDGWSQK